VLGATDLDGPAEWGPRVFAGAALLAAAVLLAALATLPRYGITSDEPAIHYAGEWQLWALTADHPERWNLKGPPPEPFRSRAYFTAHPKASDVYLFPGFPGLFCAAVAVVARHVPGYDRVDAVHAGVAILHAVTVFFMVLYVSRLLGLRRALLVGLLYALYPSAAGHSHYNVKDWPVTGFYALTVLAFAVGAVESRARFLVQSGVWLGLGLASKPNPVFAALTCALWLAVAGPRLYRGRRPRRGALIAACAIPLVAALVFYGAWPYLRAGSLPEQWAKLSETVAFFLARASSRREGFTAYPFVLVFAMTPPLDLAALGAAALLAFRSGTRESACAALGFIWLAVPLVRIAWPHANFYDANRHFLEYVPALALLAGTGLDLGLRRLVGLLSRARDARAATRAGAGLLLAALLLAAWPVLHYHPYESMYYNYFVGGLGGAQRGPLTAPYLAGTELFALDSEGDYWGVSYRNAIRALNRIAPPGAAFYPCGALIDPLTHFQPVRPDLRRARREQADYFIVIPRRTFCTPDDLDYLRAHAESVYQELRDDGIVHVILRRRPGR
jgi:hypothetical protein